MSAGRVMHPLAMTLALLFPTTLSAQPEAPAAPAAEPLPHVLQVEGEGAQVIRETAAEPLDAGEPLLSGDRLDAGRAYVQVMWPDGSRIALDRDSRLDVLSADLVTLTGGRAVVSRPAATDSALRVDTPAASVELAPAGEYRVTLSGDQTTVAVVRGRADIRNNMGEAAVVPGQQVDLRDGVAPEAPQPFNAAAYDSFVEWATAPFAAPQQGAPLDTFADPRFEAYSEVFNRHGSWETDMQYGAVWYPTVDADWRPYSVGYWTPYGAQASWLWVGRDPWGWPTHHFGRWGVNPRGRWFWMPGRQWAPAHVHWSVGPGYIGWTPLGYRDRPIAAWSDLSRPRGVYPGGTLDPGRGWTVVPSDRFGRRDPMRQWAVDPRTLDNLSAFVTQRTAPPVRYAVPRGGPYGYGSTRGPAGYGSGAPGRYAAPRTGTTTTQGRPIGPTRVGPESPGYGRPSPPPEDPYERAQRAATPRARPRTPAQADTPSTPSTPPPDSAAQRPRAPDRETPRQAPRDAAPRRETPPPPAASSGRPRGPESSTGRKAVPRP